MGEQPITLRQIAEALDDARADDDGYSLAGLTLDRLNAELAAHDWEEKEEEDSAT